MGDLNKKKINNMEKLKIKINAGKVNLGVTQVTFVLLPGEVNKIKERFGYTPTNRISIEYDDYNPTWDEYLKHNKKNIENIFLLGYFTDVEFEYEFSN